MNLSTMFRVGKQMLEGAAITDAAVDAMELLQFVCGIDRNYYYMHMDKVNVRVCQVVSRGQKIGTMGNTGEVYPVPSSYSPYSGTHLHFVTQYGYPNGSPFNPMSLY